MAHVRILLVAVFTLLAGMAAMPSAQACVLYDQLGRNICNRPKFDTSDMARKTFEQMAAECASSPITGSDEPKFTDADLAKAIISLGLLTNRIRAGGGVIDPDYASPEAEMNALQGTIGALQACQYKKTIIDRAVRALDSCQALMEEIEALDAAAQPLYEKGALSKAEWVRSLETFLPGANACRRKLGLCFNPNSATQTAAALALFRLETSLRFTSDGEARLNLKVPACTRTMMDAKLYDPKNGTQAIEYINTMVDDEFVSIGGEIRETGK